jgi:ubiquinol-cytochrome c reductase cytochrome c1 subunit
MMRLLQGVILAAMLAVLPGALAGSAWSAEAVDLKKQDWSFNGILGTFDDAALKRGYQVYSENCTFCHSLKYIAFRNLMDIGFTEDQAKAIAKTFQVTDGPDGEGNMYQRPARLSDHFVPPFENENQARYFNAGAFPPDLSLITKGRKGGPDYVYAILTGYHEPPEGIEIGPGMNYNPFFPGGEIAMPSPLFEDGIAYADGTEATVEQMAADITQFLTWAAEPKMEDRKRIGLGTMIFLVILLGLFVAVKRQVWSDVH